MQPVEALKIIEALADGFDPLTGQELPANSVYQQPPVIRALFAAAGALKEVAQHSGKSDVPGECSRPDNAGQAWSQEEDAHLSADFSSGIAINALAQRHGRTRGAIRSRLVRLGHIDPASTA